VRSLLVRLVCIAVNGLLGDTGSRVSPGREREMAVARRTDPYFGAFRARCLYWIYGDDPRRAIER
jgi:hypothetical protein